jgi:hypothetical protein
MLPSGGQLRAAEGLMADDWKSFIPWMLSLATIGAGIWQYADKQAQSNREPFLREQLKLVLDASETVATLAVTTDPKVWQENRARFWTLYWGPLGMVEDKQVEFAMVEAGRIVPAPSEPNVPALPLTALQSPSLKLSHAARDLVLRSWDVNLPQLADAK